jgi:hypothetical protein
MERTVQGYSPRFFVTAVTAATWLLCNKEADTMIKVVGGMKASGTHNATII